MMKNLLIIISLLTLVFQACSNVPMQQEETAVLLSDAKNNASCVFLTSDQNNRPVVSWIETDSADKASFYFSKWSDGNRSFASRKPISIASNISVHEEGMPKVAFKGDGTIVAIYETNVSVEGSRFGLSNLIYILSYDDGETWSAPQSIQNEDTHIGSRSFANILRLSDGEVGVSWLDTHPVNSDQGRPVKFAKTHGDEGFGDAIVLEPYACQCCRTAISDDGDGNLSVVYRDILPGSVRDISISKSSDYGRSFEEPVAFSNDQWVVEGCPHNGPSVVSKNGATFVAWYTGSQQNGVFYAELDANNNIIAKHCLDPQGRFVQLCLLSDGTRMAAFNKVYRQDSSTFSKIMVNKVNDHGMFQKEVSLEESHASYPVIQEIDDNNILVAWRDEGSIYYKAVAVGAINEVVDIPHSLGI